MVVKLEEKSLPSLEYFLKDGKTVCLFEKHYYEIGIIGEDADGASDWEIVKEK